MGNVGHKGAAKQSAPSDRILQDFFLMLIFCVLLWAPVAKASDWQAPSQRDVTIWANDFFSRALIDRRLTGAAFVVIKDDRTLIAMTYGKSNIETNAPFSTDRTLIPVGEIGGLLTVAQILELEKNGYLRTTDPVNTYLTHRTLPRENNVALESLLDGTVSFHYGRRGTLTNGRPWSRAIEFADLLPDLGRTEGTGHLLPTAANIAVLDAIIEDVTGQSPAAHIASTSSAMGLRAYLLQHGEYDAEKTLHSQTLMPDGAIRQEPAYLASPAFQSSRGVLMSTEDIAGFMRQLNRESERLINPLLQNRVQRAGPLRLDGQVQSITSQMTFFQEIDLQVFVAVTGSTPLRDRATIFGDGTTSGPTRLDAHQITNHFLRDIGYAPKEASGSRPETGIYVAEPIGRRGFDVLTSLPLRLAVVNMTDERGLEFGDRSFQKAGDAFSYVSHDGSVALAFTQSGRDQASALLRNGQRFDYLMPVDDGLKLVVSLLLTALIGGAILQAATWQCRNVWESRARYVGIATGATVLLSILIPIASFVLGWPSEWVVSPLPALWNFMQFWIIGLAGLTLFASFVAYRKKFWALDGHGPRRRFMFTLSGLAGLSWLLHLVELGAFPI